MKFLKYVGIGTLSVMLPLSVLSLCMDGNPIKGPLVGLLGFYVWLPSVLINSGIICYINKE